jgi:hypothetical protein
VSRSAPTVRREDGPSRRLAEDAAAALLIGGALMAFAAITLALKIAFIVQLIILAVEVAQAIATAFATFGATTAEVPGFIAATRVICRELIDKAVQAVEHEIARMLEQAAKLLKKTGPNRFAHGARFYSGRSGDVSMREFAEKGSDGVTATTLEQTPGGRYFDDKNLFAEEGSPISNGQACAIWGRLSERYAQSASGEVTAFNHSPRPGSIWLTRELPALRNNPKVTKITVVDPVTNP